MIWREFSILLIVLLITIDAINTVNIGVLFRKDQLKKQLIDSFKSYNLAPGNTLKINSIDLGDIDQITTNKTCSFIDKSKPIALFVGKMDNSNRDQIIQLLDNFNVPVFIFDNDALPQKSKSIFYMNSFNIESLYDLIEKKRYNNIMAIINNEISLNRIEELMKMIGQRNAIRKNIQLKYITNNNDKFSTKNMKVFLIDVNSINQNNKIINRIIRETVDSKIIMINFDLTDLKINAKNKSYTIIGWGGFKIGKTISLQSDFDSSVILDEFLKFFKTQFNRIQNDTRIKNYLINPIYKKCNQNIFNGKINEISYGYINTLLDTKNKNRRFVFNGNNKREISKLLIWFINQNNLMNIKYWSNNNKFSYDNNENLKKIRVVTIANNPFVVSLKSGFLIDFMNKLKAQLGVEVDVYFVADKRYGSKMNNKWNGMIGELLNNKADLILADLTVTKTRSEVVQFTNPIVSNSLSFVYNTTFNKVRLRNGMFWGIFSTDLWCFYVIFSFLIGGILALGLWLSPNDWRCDSKYHCEKENRNKKWSWLKGWQYSFDALVRHPARKTPKSHGVKLLLAVWWCFTLTLTCLYISLLFINITKLTAKSNFVKLSSLSDLLENPSITPMVVNGGSTYSWLSKSTEDSIKRLFKRIKTVNSYSEGIAKVKRNNDGKDNYGMLMESIVADYEVNKNCKTIGSFNIESYSRNIALATRHNSTLNDKINQIILNMGESQELADLFQKWFRPNKKCTTESQRKMVQNFRALTLSEIQGLFYFLLIMMFISLFVWLLEYIFLIRACIFSNVRSSDAIAVQNVTQAPQLEDTKKKDCFENEHTEPSTQ